MLPKAKPELQPVLPGSLKPPAVLAQLLDLTLIQLSNWRWSWRGMLITGMLTPLVSMAALAVFANSSDQQVLAYILTGNIVLALMFDTLRKVTSNFSFMKLRGMLAYFATLPIQRLCLVLATAAAFFVLSLPSLVVTLSLGALVLQLPLHIHPLLILVLPLVITPLVGLGALVAVLARTPEEADTVSFIVTVVLMAVGPVVVPPERLPAFLSTIGVFSPATYAASALRQVLLGPLTTRLALDLAVLVGVSLIVFWFTLRRMDWRRS